MGKGQGYLCCVTPSPAPSNPQSGTPPPSLPMWDRDLVPGLRKHHRYVETNNALGELLCSLQTLVPFPALDVALGVAQKKRCVMLGLRMAMGRELHSGCPLELPWERGHIPSCQSAQVSWLVPGELGTPPSLTMVLLCAELDSWTLWSPGSE